MSTKDRLLFSALHGTAVRYAAEQRNLAESIEELREIAGGRNDVLAEAAGITAGSWLANPAGKVGYELIAAGMLILAGGVEVCRWITPSWSVGLVSGMSVELLRGARSDEGFGLRVRSPPAGPG
jgi:hypothetical protein